MDELVEGLELVEEVNELIQELQESLELFKRGDKESALEKIDSVEEDIEALKLGDLPDRREIEEMLSGALNDLEWVSEHADRAKGSSNDARPCSR